MGSSAFDVVQFLEGSKMKQCCLGRENQGDLDLRADTYPVLLLLNELSSDSSDGRSADAVSADRAGRAQIWHLVEVQCLVFYPFGRPLLTHPRWVNHRLS